MFPVEIDFHEFVEVPIHAGIDQLSPAGPPRWIGQACRKDRRIEPQIAVASRHLPGPEAKAAGTQIEWTVRVDQRAVAQRLARQDIARLREPAVKGNAR